MGASGLLSSPKLRETPFYTSLLLLCLFFYTQRNSFKRLPRSSQLVYVDTLDEKNWTTISSSKISLSRVHNSGYLHHKVWILPFDEMWQVGLSKVYTTRDCPNAAGALEMHVTSGASVASAASEIASRIRRGRRVAPLIPLGRPFLIHDGADREIVHVFAMLIEGVFPIHSKNWFARVIKPVQLIRESSTLHEVASQGATGSIGEKFCTIQRMNYLTRSVSYAMRRFKLKGFVPKTNPMSEAKYNEKICCRENIDETENLERCGLPCDQQGLFNILTVFPSAR